MLLPLAGLCMDAAVNRFIIRERLGTKEIREWAFRELEKAEEEQVSDKAGTDLIHRIRLPYFPHPSEKESCTMQSLPVDPFPHRLCSPEHTLYTKA